jgi:hypothetical protein
VGESDALTGARDVSFGHQRIKNPEQVEVECG